MRRPELYALTKASSTKKIYLEICPCWGPVRPKLFIENVYTVCCAYASMSILFSFRFQSTEPRLSNLTPNRYFGSKKFKLF